MPIVTFVNRSNCLLDSAGFRLDGIIIDNPAKVFDLDLSVGEHRLVISNICRDTFERSEVFQGDKLLGWYLHRGAVEGTLNFVVDEITMGETPEDKPKFSGLNDDTSVVSDLQIYANDTLNPIEKRDSARQAIESFGRNDITLEQIIQIRNDLIQGLDVITKEEIEELGSIDGTDLIKITDNINIVLNQQNILIDNANSLIIDIQSGSLVGVPSESIDPRDKHQIALDTLESIITNSLPRNRQNLRNLVNNANDLEIILPDSVLFEIEASEIETANMINLGASIIDETPSLIPVPTIPDEPIIPIIPDEPTPSQEIPTGALLLLAPLLFIEPKMEQYTCNKQPGFRPADFEEQVFFEDLNRVPQNIFFEDEETENQNDLASSLITGAMGGALFGEPFLVRFGFADGSFQDIILDQSELDFVRDNLGPGNTLVILEDLGLKTLEARVEQNERNLVNMGTDVTALGQIDVRQDVDIALVRSDFEGFKGITSQHFIDAGIKNVQQDQSIRDAAAAGGDGGGDFLGGLLGGVGIGSIVVLIIIGILVFRKGI